MIEIGTRLEKGMAQAVAAGRLELAFDARQKSRLRAKLVSGEEVALRLPRGELLRGGDLLQAADGRVIEVVAEPEALLHVTCNTPAALARAAYHLGNRHVPVQVGEGYLRLAADHVLGSMLRSLGATVTPVVAPFEPEAGAYAGGHARGPDDSRPGRIHEHHHQ